MRYMNIVLFIATVHLYMCIYRAMSKQIPKNRVITIIIISTVVRIVGMGRMSHICNTKCSRL